MSLNTHDSKKAFLLADIEITWECASPNWQHQNICSTMVYVDLENNEVYDEECDDLINQEIMSLVSDTTFQSENPCSICQEVGFCEANWNVFNKTIELN